MLPTLLGPVLTESRLGLWRSCWLVWPVCCAHSNIWPGKVRWVQSSFSLLQGCRIWQARPGLIPMSYRIHQLVVLKPLNDELCLVYRLLIQVPYHHDVPSVRNGAQYVYILCNIFFLSKLDISSISKLILRIPTWSSAIAQSQLWSAGDEGWRFTAWTNFLTNWASSNPKMKFTLNPEIRAYFSDFDKSLSKVVWCASNWWPLLWGWI